jgi:hypothetical protein
VYALIHGRLPLEPFRGQLLGVDGGLHISCLSAFWKRREAQPMKGLMPSWHPFLVGSLHPKRADRFVFALFDQILSNP